MSMCCIVLKIFICVEENNTSLFNLTIPNVCTIILKKLSCNLRYFFIYIKSNLYNTLWLVTCDEF